MALLKMSEEERKRISEQHKNLEKQNQQKKDELKKGLQQPENTKTSKSEVFFISFLYVLHFYSVRIDYVLLVLLTTNQNSYFPLGHPDTFETSMFVHMGNSI